MLKGEYLHKIRKDKQLRGKIILITGISHTTLYNWLRKNSPMLTTSDVLSVLSDHFKVPYHDMVEPVTKKIIITETVLS